MSGECYTERSKKEQFLELKLMCKIQQEARRRARLECVPVCYREEKEEEDRGGREGKKGRKGRRGRSGTYDHVI